MSFPFGEGVGQVQAFGCESVPPALSPAARRRQAAEDSEIVLMGREARA